MHPMRWLRAPLVHFVVGGAVLFGALHDGSPVPPAPEPVVVTAVDVARLRDDYARETGLEPTHTDEAALVGRAVEEERLFREALARGLDRNDRSVRNWLVEQMRVLDDGGGEDPERLYARALALGLDRTDLVVRRILVQKMRLLAARAGERSPTDAELADFYAAHREEYRPPERVTFWHVFLSSDAHGRAVERDARALLDELRRAGRPPADSTAAGASFAVPPHVVGRSMSQVATLFGAGFAAGLAALAPGAWTGPIASPYGAHLVWVERRDAGEPPALEAVRGRVLERWLDTQRSRRLVALLRDLERRYLLRVLSSAWRVGSRS
jgi:hypothetical protein